MTLIHYADVHITHLVIITLLLCHYVASVNPNEVSSNPLKKPYFKGGET